MSESDAPVSDAQEMKDRGAFTRYRVMAFVTGGMLLLLCLEMLLKYVVQVNGSGEPVLGSWIAFVHGWIYVVYAVTVFDLWSRMRWSFGRIVVLIAGGVIPVLSFVMEQKAQGWTETTLAARRGEAATER
ncbi:DUF3817 domain-containing protein [Ruania zhangjianzhongii]|uniref:DUF3817 domain-containing protein n=1 Tax=Ruania zhangjianzhongii TaxID=2603206 RepID=UPI0011CCD0EA|nr:DUF3817 domain-containing protein [Ruania zhangjianzhongii]